MTIYLCDDDRRRTVLREQTALNGIDYLEVVNHTTLRISFVNAPAPALTAIGVGNVQVTGGERITGIVVTTAAFSAATLVVTVQSAGDFSEYTLALVDASGSLLPGLDPILAQIPFSFMVECASDFDCVSSATCAPAPGLAPDINYLTKDFTTFVSLMQNRLALLLPRWREASPADLGNTLVELLAYVADRLSYRQDAIATEAYLATARQRISLRRHARLVDYVISEGCNARAWVCVTIDPNVAGANPVKLPQGTQFLTRVAGAPALLGPNSPELARVMTQAPQAFESMTDATLYAAHDQMPFHSWGGVDCCLPIGATQATLRGAYPLLQPGDVLVFEETLGRATGDADDADPTRRIAVLLTNVAVTSDPIGAAFVPPSAGDPAPGIGPYPVTSIEWSSDDGLPFPLQVSVTVINGETTTLLDCAVARGNVVLVDHGLTVSETFVAPSLPTAPSQAHTTIVALTNPLAPPCAPQLSQSPLTHAAPLDDASASSAMTWSMSDVLPAIALLSAPATEDPPVYVTPWSVSGDLLESAASSAEFVAEIDNAGQAHLRFGDDDYGLRPDPGTQFAVSYRVGNGTNGNVGAGAIAHLVFSDDSLIGVENPIAATGGVDPETLEHIRQSAPFAFRTQKRAVTPNDYASWLEQRPDVLRAAATFRWTGSWYTVFNSVERNDQQAIDPVYASFLEAYLEQYRVVGKDLEVDVPRFVPLDIAANVCVMKGYFRSDVEAALDAVFSSRAGGVFDPANFAFGQTVYLSPLYAAAQSVQGVDSVEFTEFAPRGVPSRSGLTTGFVTMGRLEIARVANDPSFPERGQITFTMLGGQ